MDDTLFQKYLIQVGQRSLEYTYPDEVVYANIGYFSECFRTNLSTYKALLFLGDYLNGEWKFTP